MTKTKNTVGKIRAELINLALAVVQQWGYEEKYHFYHGGLSTLEDAHQILHDAGVIKNFNVVRKSEIKKYYYKLET
jgi:hypothetical protein